MNENEISIEFVLPAYNSASKIIPTLERIFELPVPSGMTRVVTVVDDASSDNTSEKIAKRFHGAVRVLRPGENLGRARAINFGAFRSNCCYLLVLDSDCHVIDDGFLHIFQRHIIENHKLCLSTTKGGYDDFWSTYHNSVVEKRIEEKNIKNLTTAVMGVKKSFYLEVGGFYEGYRGYGFEDRDFLECCSGIAQADDIVYEPRMAVFHNDELDLETLREKFRSAGKHSSAVFSRRFPQAYDEMPYGRLERLAGLPFMSSVVKLLAYGSRVIGGRWLNFGAIPSLLKISYIKLVISLEYMMGLYDRRKAAELKG